MEQVSSDYPETQLGEMDDLIDDVNDVEDHTRFCSAQIDRIDWRCEWNNYSLLPSMKQTINNTLKSICLLNTAFNFYLMKWINNYVFVKQLLIVYYQYRNVYPKDDIYLLYMYIN